MCEFIIKEKFAVFIALAQSFGGKKAKDVSGNQIRTKSKGLPSWYRPKSKNYGVVDLDGPMDSLRPFLGKNTINKKTFGTMH